MRERFGTIGIAHFMKPIPILFAVCLVSVVTGCHKPQLGDKIVAAETFIKATALAAINAKFPGESSDLKFSDLSIRVKPDGTEEVAVTYDLPSTAETTHEGQTTSTTTKVIFVAMSLSGNVENVYESRKTVQYNTTPYHGP